MGLEVCKLGSLDAWGDSIRSGGHAERGDGQRHQARTQWDQHVCQPPAYLASCLLGLVRRVSRYVLRCHACGGVSKEMGRLFCGRWVSHGGIAENENQLFACSALRALQCAQRPALPKRGPQHRITRSAAVS